MRAVITEVKVDPKPFYRSTRSLKPRPTVFLWIKDFNPIQDLFEGERYNKPHFELRNDVKDELSKRDIVAEHMYWDRHAGCTMCPCSPGWVLKGTDFEGRVDVEYEYLP